MDTPNRQPAGLPTGGQYAPTQRAASGISLVEPDTDRPWESQKRFRGRVGPEHARTYDLLALWMPGFQDPRERSQVARVLEPLGAQVSKAYFRNLAHYAALRRAIDNEDDWHGLAEDLESAGDRVLADIDWEYTRNQPCDPAVGEMRAQDQVISAYESEQRRMARELTEALAGQRDHLHIEAFDTSLPNITWSADKHAELAA